MSRDLSDGAMAELLLLKCKIPLADVMSFIEARNDVRTIEGDDPGPPPSSRDTVPSRGQTVRIGACFVEEPLSEAAQ